MGILQRNRQKTMKILLLLALVTVASAQSCPDGFPLKYGLNCYRFVRTQLTWFDADQHCTGLLPPNYDVHLARIFTSGEHDYLAQQLRSDRDMDGRDAWIGLTRVDKRRGWTWIDPYVQISYTRWAPGQPSGDGKCAHMWEDESYGWDDSDCNNFKGSICEYRLSRAPPSRTCPEGFVSYGNSCYYFVPSSLNWFDADQYCTYFRPGTYDVHLACIDNSAEQDFLVNYIKNNNDLRDRSFWISGQNMDKNRGWVWAITDKAISYFKWAPGEPNNTGKCIQLWRDSSWRWDDATCYEKAQGFVCEVKL